MNKAGDGGLPQCLSDYDVNVICLPQVKFGVVIQLEHAIGCAT